MPATNTGTEYTEHLFTNSFGDTCHYLVADHLAGNNSRKPYLLYCHGSGGPYNQFAEDPGNGGVWYELRSLLIDNGWVIVEGQGTGQGGNTTENWGSTAGCESYAEAFTTASAAEPSSHLLIMGRSMGGMCATLLAVDPTYGLAASVKGLIINSGVQSLAAWLDSAPPASNLDYLTATYGVDPRIDRAGFLAAAADHDPIQLAPSMYDGLPLRWLAGTHDDVVFVEGNARAQYERLQGHAVNPTLIVKGFGTHGSGSVGTYDMTEPMWDFLQHPRGLPSSIVWEESTVYRYGEFWPAERAEFVDQYGLHRSAALSLPV